MFKGTKKRPDYLEISRELNIIAEQRYELIESGHLEIVKKISCIYSKSCPNGGLSNVLLPGYPFIEDCLKITKGYQSLVLLLFNCRVAAFQ